MRHSDSEDRDHRTRGVSTASLLADGIETRYLRTGAGPTVLLIHPGGAAEDDLVLALARRFRVIVPDLPEDGSHPAPPDWPEDSEFQAKSARHPKTGFVPAGYVPGPVVPHMGVHWFDPTTPELNGKPFTTTFIYGSWDGRLTFAEPMITKAFIESKPDFRAPVAMAEKYEVAGYYPSSYRIYWDDATREYRIALTGLVQKR